MAFPNMQDVANYWAGGGTYKPTGTGTTQAYLDRVRSQSTGSYGGGNQSLPRTDETGWIGPPVSQQINPPQNNIPLDPFTYFSGTSPYGNYAKQVAEGYNPSQLPRLLIPSLQTWARMGPQFQQQYYGFRQAQTGAIPEQSYWNIMNLAPPSGGSMLNYRR